MNPRTTFKRDSWARIRERGVLLFTLLYGALATAFLSTGLFLIIATVWFVADVAWAKVFATAASAVPFIALGCAGLAFTIFHARDAVFCARVHAKKCVHCDYDLRASIDAGSTECPECGCAIELL